jgi:hypothetical protein
MTEVKSEVVEAKTNVVPFSVSTLPREPQALMAAVYNLPLMVLVQKKNDIMAHIEACGGELTPELEDIFDHTTMLLSGKVDRVALFGKEVIPAHIQACKDQITRLEFVQESINNYAIECVKSQGKDAKGKYLNLEGLAYRVRIQANPPKLIIDNPEKIPMMFKKGEALIKIKFDPSNAKLRNELEATCKKAVELYGATCDFSVDPDISAIKDTISDKKNQKGEIITEGTPIDGTHLERGWHCRWEASKAKASKSAGKNKEVVNE